MFEKNFNTFGDSGFDFNKEFKKDQKTFVITHGYQNTGGNAANNFQPEEWMFDKAELLRARNPEANIILVDWEDGAKPGILEGSFANYAQSARGTQELGEAIADKLIELGADASKTELIGHSLGAQASGVAGSEYREKTGNQISKIVGLDPAGPLFEKQPQLSFFPGTVPGEFLLDPSVVVEIPLLTGVSSLQYVVDPVPTELRLDATDAENVIAFHTSGTLGYEGRVADLDVYYNRDYSFQPGVGISGFVGNHGYAYEIHNALLKGDIALTEELKQFDINSLDTQTGSIDIDTRRAIFTGSIQGFFSSGSDVLSLGTPASVGSEGFIQFEGGSFVTQVNELFSLGELTYKNGVTQLGSEPKGDLPLNILFGISRPVSASTSFEYDFVNTVTENTTGNAVLDADKLEFSSLGLSTEKFEALGTEYTVDLLGFSSDDGFSTVSQFIAPEDSTETAQLLGQFSEAESRILPPLLFTKAKTRIAGAVKGSLDGLVFSIVSGLFGRRSGEINEDGLKSVSISSATSESAPGGILGGSESESIAGSEIDDFILSFVGTDVIAGGAGDDILFAGDDIDEVDGGANDDIINGNKGDDTLRGGLGDDFIRGGQGNDQIFGDEGDDALLGDLGVDTLTGGAGADTFILRTDVDEVGSSVETVDRIADFNPDEGDRLAFTLGFPVEILQFQSVDVDANGVNDTVIRYSEDVDALGTVDLFFGVLLDTTVGSSNANLLSVPAADPLL